MKKRRRARELCLQGLYALEISKNPVDQVIEDVRQKETDEEILSFACQLLRATAEQNEALDQEVMSVVKNWDLNRIALVDRLILRMALCEILNFEEIPPKVTINEAIDLAKKFSTSESGRFVNGILDSLYQHYKTTSKLAKKGRGLLE